LGLARRVFKANLVLTVLMNFIQTIVASGGIGMQIERYFSAIKEILDEILANEMQAMETVSELFTDTIANGNTIFITGCSHSSIFAQEVFYRAGGFMLMNPIFLPGMTLDTVPVTLTTKYENLSGIAGAILSESKIRKGDTLVIASVSGRNTVPVEIALWAREKGVKTVALTSLNYSEAVESRHPSGRKLYEITDYSLNVRCPKGDAVLDIDGLPEKTAPASTVTGITMLHAVISQTIENLINRGITPPVFLSANLDGGIEHNNRMFEKYKDRIHYR
jgi:uncharacterized phosphosugar-binding protein